MIRVGVTGGIGSGKSTVCRLFAQRGIAIYDSDAAAKRLMAGDPELRRAIVAEFGAEAYAGAALNRAYLARIVFSDPLRRERLNSLVHPAVRADFEMWCSSRTGDYVILESALLFEAGMADCVERIVAVMAPPDLRIERTCLRDGCTPEEVRRRIAAQIDDDELCRRADFTLVNIFEEELDSTVAELDKRFRYEARHA